MMSMCAGCRGQERQGARTRAALRKQVEADMAVRASRVILTTASVPEGYRVRETVDVVAAEYATGTSSLRALAGEITGGGRIDREVGDKLGEGRRTCLAGLKREAAALGANAVVSVELNYSGYGANGREVVLVAASGTAVRVEPAAHHEPPAPHETALAGVPELEADEYGRL